MTDIYTKQTDQPKERMVWPWVLVAALVALVWGFFYNTQQGIDTGGTTAPRAAGMIIGASMMLALFVWGALFGFCKWVAKRGVGLVSYFVIFVAASAPTLALLTVAVMRASS